MLGKGGGMKNEIIVNLGAEGGSLTLYGVRQGRRWLYSRHLFDQTMAWVDEDAPVINRDSEVVETWQKALKLLDKYQWHQLYPIEVHPEFRGKVVKAVLERSRLDVNDHHLRNWQELCNIPDDLNVEPIFQEIQIPKFGLTQGKLLSAGPSYSKPLVIDKKDWVVSLFNNVVKQVTREARKPVLAVPRSFWPLRMGALLDQVEFEGYQSIDVMDECGEINNADPMTMMNSIREIIDRLQDGQDVVVLSHTRKISGFIPALLMCVSLPHLEDPTKYWYTLVREQGLELTPFQVGYIHGLYDASGPFGLMQLRSEHHSEVDL
jgi:hypothetical protein